MKIVVIDGQGGRMGSAFIDKWIKSGGDPKELIAVGTNAMATQQCEGRCCEGSDRRKSSSCQYVRS